MARRIAEISAAALVALLAACAPAPALAPAPAPPPFFTPHGPARHRRPPLARPQAYAPAVGAKLDEVERRLRALQESLP
jgi:hypothetical protein